MTDKEISILVVKPGSLSQEDRELLRQASVVVIENAAPETVRFMRPSCSLSSDDLLYAAMKGVLQHTSSKLIFSDVLGKLILDAHGKESEK